MPRTTEEIDQLAKLIRPETIQQVNLFDDAYMSVFFDGSIECAQILVDEICGTGYKVTSAITQPVMSKYQSHGIRLDVLAKDEAGNYHDFEFQTRLDDSLPQRSRYYSGVIEQNMLEKGEGYGELAKVFIVFICAGDPFKSGLPMHTFRTRDDDGRVLNDGRTIIFINADYDNPWRLSSLMQETRRHVL